MAAPKDKKDVYTQALDALLALGEVLIEDGATEELIQLNERIISNLKSLQDGHVLQPISDSIEFVDKLVKKAKDRL